MMPSCLCSATVESPWSPARQQWRVGLLQMGNRVSFLSPSNVPGALGSSGNMTAMRQGFTILPCIWIAAPTSTSSTPSLLPWGSPSLIRQRSIPTPLGTMPCRVRIPMDWSWSVSMSPSIEGPSGQRGSWTRPSSSSGK
jgi:hypothetical protein